MNQIDRIDSKKTLFSICLMMVVSLGTLQIQPILGGALVDQLGFALSSIGSIFAGELSAMAVSCATFSLLITRIDRRKFAIGALIFLILANLVSTLASTWLTLFLCRLVCGLSGGAVMSVVFATASLRSSKDATFAVINVGNLLWGMLLVTSMPLILRFAGVRGAFLVMALAATVALVGCGRIPKSCPEPLISSAGKRPFGLAAILLITLFALLFFGHSALWVYQERIGKSIGLEPEQIGAILGGSILAGAIGAGLAGVIGRRIGLLFPQLLGFGAAFLATLVMVYGNSPIAFAMTACLIHLVWFFSLPYLLSMAAELDSTGRVAGLGNAAIFVGQGLGPFGAALVVGEGNFRAVGWLAACAYLAALVVSCAVVALFRKRSKISNSSFNAQSA